MESRVLELIICKLMTSFHDKSKPSNGDTDLQNGGAPKEPYWGQNYNNALFWNSQALELGQWYRQYIYTTLTWYFLIKNSQELHCRNVVNM